MPQSSYYTEITTYRLLKSGREIAENREPVIINRANIVYLTDVDIRNAANPELVDGKLLSLSMSDGTRLLIDKRTFNEILFTGNGDLIEIKPVTIVNGRPEQGLSTFFYALTIRGAINTIRQVTIDDGRYYRMQMANRSQLTILPGDLEVIVAATPAG